MHKKDNTIVNDDATIFATDRAGGVVINMTEGQAPAKYPGTPVEKVFKGREYASLGDSNDFFKETYDTIRKVSNIHPTLAWQSNQISGARLAYGTIRGYDKLQNEIFEPLIIPEIDDFLEENDQELYLEEIIRDLKFWSHGYALLSLNKTRTKIVHMSTIDTMHCRFSLQNAKTGHKDFVYVDANWPDGKAATWKKYANLDPYYRVVDQIKYSSNTEWVYAMSFSSPGRIYYQDTPWHVILNTSWLDVMQKIPKFKRYLLEHQMSPKYIIHVPLSWWTWKYPLWTKMTPAEKETARNDVRDEFNKHFKGVESTGKALMLTFNDATAHKQFAKWEVQEMKGNWGDGAYIEDSQEASEHTLYALTQQGSLIGKPPGKGHAPGSGSDIRVGMNVFMINNKPFLSKAAKPYAITTKYNGWKGPKNERVVWRAVNYQINTMDKGKDTTTDATPTEQ